MTLKVNEIFCSIQGESTTAGFPAVFIRLSGCNLNCLYCDTPQAGQDHNEMEVDAVIDRVKGFNMPGHVTLTGGEPLCQQESLHLISSLINDGYCVQLETNGSRDMTNIPPETRKIVDVKTPSSGEAGSFLMENINCIGKNDEIKFIISNKIDYDFSKEFIIKYLAGTEAVINFSPAYNFMSYSELADYILRDRLNVRLNLQLHKIIGIK